MNTHSSQSNVRDQGRPLNATASCVAPYGVVEAMRDDAWEVVVRFLLIICLLSSVAICGLSLNRFASPTSVVSSVTALTNPAKQTPPVSATSTAVCTSTGGQKPAPRKAAVL